MSEGSELHQSVLHTVLYALMELVKVDGTKLLGHLTFNVPDYYGNTTQRDRVVELADYLAKKLETICTYSLHDSLQYSSRGHWLPTE